MEKAKVLRDQVNRFLTTGLFEETAQQPTFVAYTLEQSRKEYIELGDPTGYRFAEKYLDGYPHWVALKESPPLKRHILSWEEELEVKLRCEALEEIRDLSKTDKGYQAAKYLAEKGWDKRPSGRPNKKEAERESRVRDRIYDEFRPKAVK